MGTTASDNQLIFLFVHILQLGGGDLFRRRKRYSVDISSRDKEGRR
jgi:hypothetical protein